MAQSKFRLAIVCVALIGTAVAGCSSTGSGYFAAASSTSSLDLSASVADTIAADMAGHLARTTGAGKGAIVLGSKQTLMSRALETNLRALGFAIDPSAKGVDAIALGYAITGNQDQIFVRITTPTLELARIYATTPLGADPVTPLSILRRAESWKG